jgi:D-psicose/D-tagatose/L-ribulose 3-epimerase
VVARFGASTFIWVSPFSNKTLDLIDRVRAFGFDLIEVCVEDPDTIDLATIRARITNADLGITICGAFGPNRDLSSEDQSVQKAGLSYLRRCIDFAQALDSPFVSGPMDAPSAIRGSSTRMRAARNGSDRLQP